MPLYQIHWQNKKDTNITEFAMQREINNQDEMSQFTKDAWKEYPPPEGFMFMVCNEKSKHFLMTEDPDAS